MLRITTSLTAFAFVSLVLACGASPGGADGSSTGGATGGTGVGGTAAGSGGAASGGTGAGSGGDATGGSGAGAAYVCPPASDALVLDLTNLNVEPIADVPAIVNNGGFLEGPVWVGGALYLSQLSFENTTPYKNPSKILKYTPGSGFEPLIGDSGSNGLAVNGAGQLVSANHKVGGLVLFDIAPEATGVPVVTDTPRFNSPNDLTMSSDGHIYFTDPTHQAASQTKDSNDVYHVNPEGVITAYEIAFEQPNGISLSPDGNALYVGGSGGGGVIKYAVAANGSLSGPTPFGTATKADGLGIDCAGNVYVTTIDANVQVFSSAGAPLGTINAGAQQTTNVAFGGPNHTTLYITSFGDNKGQLFSVELNVPGFPY